LETDARGRSRNASDGPHRIISANSRISFAGVDGATADKIIGVLLAEISAAAALNALGIG